MNNSSILRLAFWAVLALFLAWDWSRAVAIDMRQEPPLIAAGSGKPVEGGHCSMAK
jgi:hypothetical protein